MSNLSTFEQSDLQITKEQAKAVDDAVRAFNEHMYLSNNPIRLKIDDAHNTKEFFFYTDKIITEPSIVNGDGYRIFNGDTCTAHSYCGDIEIFADKQPIKIYCDDEGNIHSELEAYGGSTGSEPDDGPEFENTHNFEPDEITLIESK